MQNDKIKKYNHLIYRILCNISTHASGLSSKRLRRDDATLVFTIV